MTLKKSIVQGFVMGLRNIVADAFKYACCKFKFFVQVVYMDIIDEPCFVTEGNSQDLFHNISVLFWLSTMTFWKCVQNAQIHYLPSNLGVHAISTNIYFVLKLCDGRNR